MGKKIIFFELNEVPVKIIKFYAKTYPDSAFAQILNTGKKFETYTEDIGHLSPWITWPSLHRGVANNQHFITDFGQDISEQNKAFPAIWEILARSGIKTGVFASLHTYPVPQNMLEYEFFVPDLFAAGSECFPKKLQPFQAFNLMMSRESGRNVSTNIPWKDTLSLISTLPDLGFRPKTFIDITNQLIEERLDKWKAVRRRTYQSVLAFDIFFKQLKNNKPAFSTFFTNHVASSMHRYWAATFPEDYEELHVTREWIETYHHEIAFTMKKADEMLGRLVAFVEQNPDYALWILSSMGQEATEAKNIETQLYIKDKEKFMSLFGVQKHEWETKPAMLPQFNLVAKMEKSQRLRDLLDTFYVNDKKVDFREPSENYFSIDLGHANLDETVIKVNNQIYTIEESGLENIEITDKSGTTAYHIPEGSFIIYEKGISGNKEFVQVSALEVAPTILDNFAVQKPAYMKSSIKEIL